VGLPRQLHPLAWWLWALALATAASRTTNPLLLALILVVAGVVVASRRGDAPWALSYRYYLIAGAVIVTLRVVFRILFGGGAGGTGEHILFTLPEIPLPRAAAGIRLFGPVAAEQVLAGFYDGLRLATMLACLGAANALANPKRMLRAVPAALYEVGTAVVVALSVAPQLIESVLRVRRARRLRGGRERGVRAVRAIAIPVLVDAMDRSLQLAAAMDARGYGRQAALSAGPSRRRWTRLPVGVVVVAGLLGVCVGLYGLLDGTTPRFLGLPMLAAGAVLAGSGLALTGRRVHRSIYRPDRWRLAEVAVAGSGVLAAVVMYATGSVDPADLYPSLSPLGWPQLSLLATAGVLVAVLPAWLAPPPLLAPANDRPAPAPAAEPQPAPAPRTDAGAAALPNQRARPAGKRATS
jgi:energy-coupling factor transport system permease protein